MLCGVHGVQDPVEEAVYPGVDPGHALGAAESGAETDHAYEVRLVEGGDLEYIHQSESSGNNPDQSQTSSSRTSLMRPLPLSPTQLSLPATPPAQIWVLVSTPPLSA